MRLRSEIEVFLRCKMCGQRRALISRAGFEIRPLLGMNQQTLLPEIEFFSHFAEFFQKNLHDDVTVTIKI